MDCAPSAISRLLASASRSAKSQAATAAPTSHPVTVRPPSGPQTSSAGSGQPPAGYPRPAADGVAPVPDVTDPQGDELILDTTIPAAAYPDPNNPGSYLLDCSGNGPVFGGENIGFCGFVELHDATTGSQTTTNNTQSDSIFDACGRLVGSGSTFGWHIVGTSYLVSAWIGSLLYTVPTSGVCWGQWSETYTFTQTFTNGQQLSDTKTDTFNAFPVNPAPPNAYGVGNGDASVHNPTCNGGDPVNCASGNFSDSFTDVSVQGRGPGLALTRTYNSLSAASLGIFGYGWTSSYEAHLTANGDGSATVFEADGSQVTGQPTGGGSYSIPPWADSTLTQNADGTWSFVQRGSVTLTFDGGGRLTAITDRNGYSTTLAYNGSGQLSTVTDSANRALTFTFGTNGLVSQVTDPAGQSTNYGYDGSGNLTSVADRLTRATSFGYDSSHLLQTVTDPNQGPLVNVYDSSGRVTQQTDPAGLATNFAYTGDNFSTAGGTTTITDQHGSVTVENYTSGVMVSITRGSGTAAAGTWNYGYDPNTFGVASVTDPAGHVTRSTYDSRGNLLTRTDALGRTTTYTYNQFNEPLSVTDPRGIVTAYTYDSSGNVLTKTVTGAGGSPVATTTYRYTDSNAGDITQTTDPAGHVADYTYDVQGDQISLTTHPSTGVNNTTAASFDTLGRKVCQASPVATAAGVQCPAAGQPRVANTTTWVYDAVGELVSRTNALGQLSSYSYDGDGNRTQVIDAAGNVTKTTYDTDSRRSTVTAGFGTPAAATTSYSYDLVPGTGVCSGSVPQTTYCAAATDPGGAATVEYFNSRDERIQLTQPSSGTSTSTYDAAGNLSTLTTNGGKSTYGYDGANELTSITYSNPATGYTAAGNVSYGYDADGRRSTMTDASGTTSYAYDALERLASVTNGAGAVISYGYDLDNEVTSIVYPGRNQTVTQTYDSAGREASVTDWLGHRTSFSYDADGNLTSNAYPNATTATSTFDAADNLLTSKAAPNANPSNPFASFTYTYNADSQVQTETDTGTPGPTSQTYSYDQVDRVTSATAGAYGYNSSSDLTQLPQGTQTFTASHEVMSQGSSITRVGTTSAGDSGTGASLSFALPAGVVANDQILLSVTLPGNQSIKTTPSGYTLVGSFSSGTGASNVKLAVYRRTAAAGDSTVSITFSKTFAKAATVAVYRGVNPSAPIDISSNATTATGQSVVVPSVTTTKSGDELVLTTGAESATAGTWTAPASMTARVNQAGGPSIATAAADQILGAPASSGSRTATFSVTGSLAGVLIALQPTQSTYTYDSLGDRRTITTPAGTSTLAYNQVGQLTGYGSTTYTYNGDGLRTAKKTGHSTESFTWEPTGPGLRPLPLVDGGNSYVYGPQGVPLEQINGTAVLYYVHDRIGSTRVLTNSSGAVAASATYAPYGGLAGSTGTAANPFGFAGSYTDSESGLLYLQNRYYDTATGQFITVDPMVELTAAAYAYASGDPVNVTDSAGLCSDWDPLCDLGQAIGDHWRGIAQAATVVVAGLGGAACVVLTDGLCIAALPAIGAATSAALYGESDGPHDLNGYARSALEGDIGGALAGLCALGPCEIGGFAALGGVAINGGWGAEQGVVDYLADSECPTLGGLVKAGGIGFVEGGAPWDEIFKFFYGAGAP
ncbi:MAG: DUF6531 domain-containing protein [Gaiellaceae bacterium]